MFTCEHYERLSFLGYERLSFLGDRDRDRPRGGATKDSILVAFERRIAHDVDTEFAEALIQIEHIALLRLKDRLPA